MQELTKPEQAVVAKLRNLARPGRWGEVRAVVQDGKIVTVATTETEKLAA